MPLPLDKTFDLLACTPNPSAVSLLVAALDSSDEEIQALAVRAIVKRTATRGIVEIIRRSQVLAHPARALVEKNAPALSRGLREALLAGDAGLRSNALEMVRLLEAFGEMPTLIRLLEDQAIRDREAVESTIFDLVNRLHEHTQFGKDHDDSISFLRDAQRIRHQMLATLEAACHRFHIHRSHKIIEALLVLSDPENIYLKKLFHESSDEVRGIATEMMSSSRHPGVMSLAVACMGQNYPLPAVFLAFEKRTDPEFMCLLLQTWPRQLTTFQQKNFKELRSVAWLDAEALHLNVVPAALQRAAVAFLMVTGLGHASKMAVLEWMVRFGSPDGRLAATDVLIELEDNKVQDVVLESLDSEEPEVQAWATSQLRTWSIPNAMELLVERLDSPIPEVRQAARAELAGFDIHRALDSFDQLDPRLQTAVGSLVRKIDPDATQKLKDEMLTAIRSKRIRAARAALAFKMQNEVLDALLVMARDPDNLVRRTATDVLGHVPSREAAEMLLELKRDPSPRVRDAALAALAELKIAHDRPPASSRKEPSGPRSPVESAP